MSIFEQFKTNIVNLITPETGVLAAVSGGADSVCLLHLLGKLQKSLDFKLHVAHVNYNLRNESSEDMEFVDDICKKFNIPFHSLSCNKPSGVNTQEWARNIRYDFFRKICEQEHLKFICTAHNLGDQAETVLLHLSRGTGIYGLQGMKMVCGNILRPLLNIPRELIEFWLNIEGISFRTDASNHTDAYSRNFIRHKIIPLFEELNPRFLHDILKTSQIHADLISSFDRQTAKLTLPDNSGEFKICLKTFSALFDPLKHHYIYRILSEFSCGNGQNVSSSNISAILSLEYAQPGKKHLFADIIAEKSYEHIVFYRAEELPETFILHSGTNKMSGYSGVSEIIIREYEIKDFDIDKIVDNAIFFDYNTLNFPLKIRGKHDGDRFCPCGMNGRHVKLKNYFSDRKIERRLRQRIPLLCDNSDTILAVIGMRRSEHAYVNKNTKKVLVVEFY